MNSLGNSESFAEQPQEQVVGDIINRLEDEAIKFKATMEVSKHLISTFHKNRLVTWEKLDKQPTANILETSINCMHAGRLEEAALGIVYLLYQKHVKATNKADAKLEGGQE